MLVPQIMCAYMCAGMYVCVDIFVCLYIFMHLYRYAGEYVCMDVCMFVLCKCTYIVTTCVCV